MEDRTADVRKSLNVNVIIISNSSCKPLTNKYSRQATKLRVNYGKTINTKQKCLMHIRVPRKRGRVISMIVSSMRCTLMFKARV